MINYHRCKNSLNRFGTGIEVSIEGMNIHISSGTFDILDKNLHLDIDEYLIPLEIKSEQRLIRIYLVEDINEPIVCTDEVGFILDNGIESPLIMTLVNFYIPPNCSDLSTIDIDVWHYEDIEGVENNG